LLWFHFRLGPGLLGLKQWYFLFRLLIVFSFCSFQVTRFTFFGLQVSRQVAFFSLRLLSGPIFQLIKFLPFKFRLTCRHAIVPLRPWYAPPRFWFGFILLFFAWFHWYLMFKLLWFFPFYVQFNWQDWTFPFKFIQF
jgi:hypothetical protein